MFSSVLSCAGLITLLKPPWAKILQLIGLIDQLTNKYFSDTNMIDTLRSIIVWGIPFLPKFNRPSKIINTPFYDFRPKREFVFQNFAQILPF